MAKKRSEGVAVLLKLLEKRHPIGIVPTTWRPPYEWRRTISMNHLSAMVRMGLVRIEKGSFYYLTASGLEEARSLSMPGLPAWYVEECRQAQEEDEACV